MRTRYQNTGPRVKIAQSCKKKLRKNKVICYNIYFFVIVSFSRNKGCLWSLQLFFWCTLILMVLSLCLIYWSLYTQVFFPFLFLRVWHKAKNFFFPSPLFSLLLERKVYSQVSVVKIFLKMRKQKVAWTIEAFGVPWLNGPTTKYPSSFS